MACHPHHPGQYLALCRLSGVRFGGLDIEPPRVMPLKRAVTEFGKTYKDRFALRTYPGTSVPIFIFILGWSRTKPRVTLSAQTMIRRSEA